MQLAGGHGGAHRRLEDLEDLRAQRIVLLLALVQEVTDVQEDETVDVRLDLELRLEAAQTVDEDEGVTLGKQLLQRLVPARTAKHADVVRRSSPQPPAPQ